uniref:Uncharacterized protein n=1 Tax=Lactuca sativa TaxID=4236 RepID=A0A9R1W7H6_LACSA|nr:hypothetical protein LSAT_V11C300129860 [Lactuca sativa]
MMLRDMVIGKDNDRGLECQFMLEKLRNVTNSNEIKKIYNPLKLDVPPSPAKKVDLDISEAEEDKHEMGSVLEEDVGFDQVGWMCR